MNLNKIRIDILNEFKPYVVKYGWSETTFKKMIKNSNFENEEVFNLFPSGYISLVQLYLDDINNKMTVESNNLNLIRLKTHERIRDLCILRLNIMKKEKELISKTFYHLLLPSNYKFNLKNLYKTVDQIWFLSGDSSTDFNFYSKRAILASIYLSTIIHFINNNDFKETVSFLNKQLKRVSKIPKIKEKFNGILSLAPHFFKLRKKLNFTKQ